MQWQKRTQRHGRGRRHGDTEPFTLCCLWYKFIPKYCCNFICIAISITFVELYAFDKVLCQRQPIAGTCIEFSTIQWVILLLLSMPFCVCEFNCVHITAISMKVEMQLCRSVSFRSCNFRICNKQYVVSEPIFQQITGKSCDCIRWSTVVNQYSRRLNGTKIYGWLADIPQLINGDFCAKNCDYPNNILGENAQFYWMMLWANFKTFTC